MASFAEDGRPFWIAHGVLMILAWGVFIPLGTLLAVYRRYVGKTILKKEPSFYPWHRNLQMIGFLLTFLAFGLAAAGSQRVYGTGRAFDDFLLNFTNPSIAWNRHVKWGISVLCISGAQVVLGIWHHWWKVKHDSNPDAKPWKRPLVPSWFHVILGVVCVLVAYITMYQGLQLFNYIYYASVGDGTGGGIIAGYTVVSLSGFLFLCSYVYEKVKLMMGAGKEVPKQPDEEENVEVEQPAEDLSDKQEPEKIKEPGWDNEPSERV